MAEINELQDKIRDFAERRQWGKFHTPKNLAMALSGEAGELSAEFQWMTPEEASSVSDQQLENIQMEIADVAIYLFRLCDVLAVDLKTAIEKKLSINEGRFPEVK